MSLVFTSKDPDEVLDYQIDWTNRLAGDTIDSFLVQQLDVDSDVVIDSSAQTGAFITVWLSNGMAGEMFEMLCRITTVGGRVMDETVTMQVTDR